MEKSDTRAETKFAKRLAGVRHDIYVQLRRHSRLVRTEINVTIYGGGSYGSTSNCTRKVFYG